MFNRATYFKKKEKEKKEKEKKEICEKDETTSSGFLLFPLLCLYYSGKSRRFDETIENSC